MRTGTPVTDFRVSFEINPPNAMVSPSMTRATVEIDRLLVTMSLA